MYVRAEHLRYLLLEDGGSLGLITCLSRFPLKLNFSEEHYFENILENLRCEAHKSLKKLREPVDPDM